MYQATAVISQLEPGESRASIATLILQCHTSCTSLSRVIRVSFEIDQRSMARETQRLGKTATGGHPPLRVPTLAVSSSKANPTTTQQTNVRVLGSLSLAVCTCEVLGSSPLAVILVSLQGGGPQGLHQAGGACPVCRRRVIKSASEKGTECRGRFLATRGNGAEPNARRSGLPRCCTCAAASGMRAVRK